MKHYPAIAVIAILLLILPACKKTDKYPFWNDRKKFEFQNYSFVYTEGDRIYTILLDQYNEVRPKEANVRFYEAIIGGQTSFANPSPMQNFIYTTNERAEVGNFAGSDINLSSGTIAANIEGRIQEVGAGQMFDSRKIASLVYNGKTYLPNTHNYGIAEKDQPGASTNRLITHDKDCFLNTCVNGVQQEIRWNYNYTAGTMRIEAGPQKIEGTISNYRFSTPTLQAADGSTYIIQFFSNYTAACACTMEFKLYKVETHKAEPRQPAFKLVIGDC